MKLKSIGTRIGGGFGAILALMAIISVVALMDMNKASDGVTEYREMARDSNLVGRLQANMLMVRMNVKDFILSGKEQELEHYQTYKDQMLADMRQAEADIHDPARAAKMDEVAAMFQDYDQAFARVQELKARRNDIVRNTLDVLGTEMEAALTGIMESAFEDDDALAGHHAGMALRHLLLGRLYMAKFLDTNSQADADRTTQEFSELEGSLDQLGRVLANFQRRELLAGVHDRDHVYYQAFEDLVGVIQERNAIMAETLDRIGPMVAQNTDEVKLSIQDVQDELGPVLVASLGRAETIILTVGAAALLIGLFIAWRMTRSITGPVNLISAGSRRIALGDTELKGIDNDEFERVRARGDELGETGRAFGDLVSYLRDNARAAETISRGDMNARVRVASEDDTLGRSFEMMVDRLNSFLSQVRQTSEHVAASSEQVGSSSQSLSAGATQQAASIEEITSSMVEIGTQTRSSADNAEQANRLAVTARNAAEQGGRDMGDLTRAMGEINEASQSISKIIKVIDEIAFQTNLLALNAAVEAARAGQHGKGFAVVAEEVRNLASRSAQAARETSELIESTVAKVDRGGAMVTSTAKSLGEITESVARTSDLVAEIAAAAQEQAQGIAQVNTGLEQIDGVTQQNTANAEENASAADMLSDQASQLKDLLARFTIRGDAGRQHSSQVAVSDGRDTLPEAGGRRPARGGDGVLLQVDPAMLAKSVNGNGNGNGKHRNSITPEQVIALDDKDFGRY